VYSGHDAGNETFNNEQTFPTTSNCGSTHQHPCLGLTYPAADRPWTESEMAAWRRVFREAEPASSRCFSPRPTSTALLAVAGIVQHPGTAVEAFRCSSIQFRLVDLSLLAKDQPPLISIETGHRGSADFDCDWISTFEGPSSFAIRIKE
jgi:hypothetical protein